MRGIGLSRFWSSFLAVVMAAGVVVATPVWAVAQRVGEVPGQKWGSAEGRSHAVSAEDTSADSGARSGAGPADGLDPDPGIPRHELVDPPVLETEVEVGATPVVGESEGFDARTSREAVGRRAEDRQVFTNADGTETVRFFDGRKFFQGADGSWEVVDPTLVDVGERYRTRADSAVKSFADSVDAATVASVVVGEGRSFGFGVRDAAPVAGVVSGDEITYPGVREDAHLHLQATASGTKETISVQNPEY